MKSFIEPSIKEAFKQESNRKYFRQTCISYFIMLFSIIFYFENHANTLIFILKSSSFSFKCYLLLSLILFFFVSFIICSLIAKSKSKKMYFQMCQDYLFYVALESDEVLTFHKISLERSIYTNRIKRIESDKRAAMIASASSRSHHTTSVHYV